jgi:hypothetical protein
MAKTATVHRLEHLHRDRGYRHTDRDPDMEWICNIITQSGKDIGDVIESVLDVSGNQVHVSYSMIAKWMNGKTKKPRNFSITWVSRGLGYERKWTKNIK